MKSANKLEISRSSTPRVTSMYMLRWRKILNPRTMGILEVAVEETQRIITKPTAAQIKSLGAANQRNKSIAAREQI
jgi:hypothetical protein